MKNKIGIILVSTFLAFSGVACGGGTSSSSSSSSSAAPSTSTSSSSSSSSSSSFNDFDGQKISFHYQRADEDYSNWALWLWHYPDGSGVEYTFDSTDDFGGVCTQPLSEWQKLDLAKGLGFIVKTKGSWNAKDPDGDRIVDFSKAKLDSNNTYNIYLLSGDSTIYYELNDDVTVFDKIQTAEFLDSTTIEITATSPFASYKITEDGVTIAEEKLDTPTTTKKVTLSAPADFNKSYEAVVTFEGGKESAKGVDLSGLYKSEEFDQAFTYSGNDLGVVYTPQSTSFKVWSPVSSDIKLRIYDSGTPTNIDSTNGSDEYIEYDMAKGEKGVWSKVIDEDLAGKYYTFVVNNSKWKNKEIVDPYAYSAGINGLRGMIVDFSKTNPDGWDEVNPHQYDRKSLVVYETHVADVSSSDTWGGTPENAKIFKGMYETGTTYKGSNGTYPTGFDHIKSLGVNAVQIIPFYDQANDETNMTFNWGYNPLNYNVVEGGYSSNPYDGYTRIRELKELIAAYNGAGINIIMDVVYNHMASAGGSPFDVLMPGYYFRYNADGSFANGSGCGNETASEMPMMRKFMIDSTTFWAREYKLGGFRFDLMGLHDVPTMNKIVEECRKINPAITIYGEPWDMTKLIPNPAIQANGADFVGFGQFNDYMRDGILAGGLSGATAKAWVSNTASVNGSQVSSIVRGIQGITNSPTQIPDPDKTVNYATCHDNYTLYDRFDAAGVKSILDKYKMVMLANALVLTSQGTSFMLAGEEFARTKGGDHNSYMSSYEVNELDYSRMDSKLQNKVENYKKLINLKTKCNGLHLDKEGIKTFDVETNDKLNLIEYTIKDTLNNKEYKIVHANGVEHETYVDFSGYSLYLDTLGSNNLTLSSKTKIERFQTIIAVR